MSAPRGHNSKFHIIVGFLRIFSSKLSTLNDNIFITLYDKTDEKHGPRGTDCEPRGLVSLEAGQPLLRHPDEVGFTIGVLRHLLHL